MLVVGKVRNRINYGKIETMDIEKATFSSTPPNRCVFLVLAFPCLPRDSLFSCR